jgi:hypothetical protein
MVNRLRNLWSDERLVLFSLARHSATVAAWWREAILGVVSGSHDG